MTTESLPEIDLLWDFSDPAETESRFRALLEQVHESPHPVPTGYREQVMTQLARTLGLQRKFEEAHDLLDQLCSRVAQWTTALSAQPALVVVRYMLERGRVFNSSGEKDDARPLFQIAWNHAREHELDGLAVDAAHMLAIAAPDPEDALRWNEEAMRVVESSNDQKARKWLGSLHNNIGWICFDSGKYDLALIHFERALEEREKQGDDETIRIARWCIAKTLRLLDRVDAALEIQQDLLDSIQSSGNPDGYINEELAECLHALGKIERAQPHFQRAYELLSQDESLRENESKRLERLKELAGVE